MANVALLWDGGGLSAYVVLGARFATVYAGGCSVPAILGRRCSGVAPNGIDAALIVEWRECFESSDT